MGAFAAEQAISHTKAKSNRDCATFRSIWAIGATGAVGAAQADATMALTRTGTGAYSCVIPKGKRAWARVGIVESTGAALVPAIQTVNAQTGALTFTVKNLSDAATDPASGSALNVTVEVEI